MRAGWSFPHAPLRPVWLPMVVIPTKKVIMQRMANGSVTSSITHDEYSTGRVMQR